MPYNPTAWASKLKLPRNLAERFTEILYKLGLSPEILIEIMVSRTVRADDDLAKIWPDGIGRWRDDWFKYMKLEHVAVSVLPSHIRPSGRMWPDYKPFPWTAEECKAVMMGYMIRWYGSIDDFQDDMIGHWREEDGYVFLEHG